MSLFDPVPLIRKKFFHYLEQADFENIESFTHETQKLMKAIEALVVNNQPLSVKGASTEIEVTAAFVLTLLKENRYEDCANLMEDMRDLLIDVQTTLSVVYNETCKNS